jgi:transcriptional regulator with PAS, ATPase and Fis domain
MLPILEQLRLVAASNLTVLFQGETGVGKEVLAQYLHAHSQRCKAPLVPVNCGALTPGLLESTLFGAVRGAFTGAMHDSKGLVRAAHQGTLFLDEIGELPLEAQSRLLRVLQERKVTPVGSHQEIEVDFRLVCATHRDLRNAVQKGEFREDLFYRIHSFPVQIPPLRTRQADILALANSLWQEMHPSEAAVPLQECCRDSLLKYSWPGNIRQLRNVLERFSVLRRQGVEVDPEIRTASLVRF